MRLLPLIILLYWLVSLGCTKKTEYPTLLFIIDTVKYHELKKTFSLSRDITITANNGTELFEFAMAKFTYDRNGGERRYDVGDIYCDSRKLIFLDWGRSPINIYLSSLGNIDSFLSGDNNTWSIKGNDRFSPITYQDPSHFPDFTTPLPDTVDRTEVMTISITHAVGFDVYITGIDTPVSRIIKVVDSIVHIPDSILSAFPQNSNIRIKAYSEVINAADGANFSKVSTWEKPLWIR